MKNKLNYSLPILPSLTYNERVIISKKVKSLLLDNIDKAYTSYDIIRYIEDELGVVIKPAKLRKIINYLRSSGETIISGKFGYSYSNDKGRIMETIRQLKSRVEAINNAVKGMEYSITLDSIADDLDFI